MVCAVPGSRAKLTARLRQRITRDWLRELPSLGRYRPMWLMRRCGPLLVGVRLERDLRDESYLPTFHVHCLLGDIDEVTMTLAEPLRRGRRPHAISAELHDPYCVEAAREMAKQAAVPLAGPVTLEQVVAAYRERIRELESEAYPVDLFSDVIGLCAYFGRRDTAERALDQLAERMKKWSEKTMPAAEVAQLLAMLRGWIAAPEMLRSLEATQAKLLRVEHLPTSALVS